MRRSLHALSVPLLLVSLVAAQEPPTFTETERARILTHSPLGPPPADPSNRVADDARAARLGQMLFFEPRLSPGGVSCASCHVPAHAFTDGKVRSHGIGDGKRNTPSLWNVAYNRWFFWDGRRDSLWAQGLVPIENGTEMAGSRKEIARLLAKDPELGDAYGVVFGPSPDEAALADPLAIDRAYANLGKAIEAYERKLLSRRSPFDRFVEGLRESNAEKESALGAAARRGLKLFVGRANCRQCHSGPNFTDGEFHRIGIRPGDVPGDAGRYAGIDAVLHDPFNGRGTFSDEKGDDRGEKLRYLKKSPECWGQFKTPSLRNVARTAPYMHQGQVATLQEVLHHYSTLEGVAAGDAEASLVPLRLTEGEIDDLIAFLETLTDESIDPALLAPPTRVAN